MYHARAFVHVNEHTKHTNTRNKNTDIHVSHICTLTQMKTLHTQQHICTLFCLRNHTAMYTYKLSGAANLLSQGPGGTM